MECSLDNAGAEGAATNAGNISKNFTKLFTKNLNAKKQNVSRKMKQR